MVPHPDLSGATEQMSNEEVQIRLFRKAEELRSDTSLTEVLMNSVVYRWIVVTFVL